MCLAMQYRFSDKRTFRSKFKVDASVVEPFAELSGDQNPIHLDPEEGKACGYPPQVGNGANIPVTGGPMQEMIQRM